MCADECARVRVRVWEQFILVLRRGVVVLWCGECCSCAAFCTTGMTKTERYVWC